MNNLPRGLLENQLPNTCMNMTKGNTIEVKIVVLCFSFQKHVSLVCNASFLDSVDQQLAR